MKTLYRFANTALGKFIIRILFTKVSFMLPVKRLRETDTLIAFEHPKPDYPVHILLMPKLELPNFMALEANDPAFMADVVSTTQSLVEELELDKTNYRLIVNGGSNQHFPHLHFHLISGR
ncbi:MAG: HIT domain-containing protein [Anaerolineae bacterium]|jgi:histidine triad (HIT) family protein|nr:HIT domain-containing protein [Anaerolineae bacterium]MBT7070263.1 HIT domain-containing protein [Anaerolineae bacterium]MBT7324271.1 HIT domain-containing protein [Anaerolineae bacterium]